MGELERCSKRRKRKFLSINIRGHHQTLHMLLSVSRSQTTQISTIRSKIGKCDITTEKVRHNSQDGQREAECLLQATNFTSASSRTLHPDSCFLYNFPTLICFARSLMAFKYGRSSPLVAICDCRKCKGKRTARKL